MMEKTANNFEAELPSGYVQVYHIDAKSKKTGLVLNLVSLIIMAIVMVIAVSLLSLRRGSAEKEERSLIIYGVTYVVFLISMIAYIVLHELVHGVAMKLCGTKKVKYGFTGLYAFAGSTDFYGKGAYIFIALAPVVFWGIILAVITPLVNNEWFWVVYFVQVFNLSGAAGDLFVTFKFSRFPKDILISDNGVGMIVYSKE